MHRIQKRPSVCIYFPVTCSLYFFSQLKNKHEFECRHLGVSSVETGLSMATVVSVNDAFNQTTKQH